LLRELGVPFELELVDRDRDAHKGPEYLNLNPAGRIPTLVDGGLVISETAAICLHLADKYPEAGLAPQLVSNERARLYQWLMFLTNTIQPDILMFYYNERYTSDPDGGAAVKQAAAKNLQKWFQIVEDNLGEGPYFLGQNYSVLDPYLTILVRWGRYLAQPPASLPKTGALVRNVLQRPAVQATITAEGIVGDFLT